jgi:hypothetical protein
MDRTGHGIADGTGDTKHSMVRLLVSSLDAPEQSLDE